MRSQLSLFIIGIIILIFTCIVGNSCDGNKYQYCPSPENHIMITYDYNYEGIDYHGLCEGLIELIRDDNSITIDGYVECLNQEIELNGLLELKTSLDGINDWWDGYLVFDYMSETISLYTWVLLKEEESSSQARVLLMIEETEVLVRDQDINLSGMGAGWLEDSEVEGTY